MNENANAGLTNLHTGPDRSLQAPSGTNTRQRSIRLVPVRLREFQKELEEAANEPIFIETIKHESIDESESDAPESEDDISQPEDAIEVNDEPEIDFDTNNTNHTAPKPAFAFLTPNGNKIEQKIKFTQSLKQITEYSARKVNVSTLQTPINKLLRTPGFSQSEKHIEKNNKNSLHDAIDGVKCLSTQDNVSSVKKLHFNHFVTPTVNRLHSLTTPRTVNSESYNAPPGVTATRTPVGRSTAYPKSTFLNAEKKYLESSSNATNDKRIRKDSKGKDEKVENKENVSNNKILWSGQAENPIRQFEKLTVGKVEYIVLNQLGKGGSSVVYHCYDPVGKLERAVKKVSLTGDRMCVEGYINEVKMLHKLQDCDRIIKMYAYEIIKEEKVLYMVLQKGERDLSAILKDLAANTKHLPVYMLIYYWMEMLYAVKQIHANGIIHSDLKPANFLVASSGLKLIDFGIASSMQADVTHVVKSVQIGSFNYISPEALRNNSHEAGTAEFKISYKSDVWSLGCILYQLVYRRTPFQHIGHTFAKLSAIQDPEQKINYPEADWVPPNIITTTKACLQYNMRSRPSIDVLIKQYENMYY